MKKKPQPTTRTKKTQTISVVTPLRHLFFETQKKKIFQNLLTDSEWFLLTVIWHDWHKPPYFSSACYFHLRHTFVVKENVGVGRDSEFALIS